MNYSIVFYIIGWILNFEAAFMALPTAVALIYRESEVWCFLATMAVCLMVGTPKTEKSDLLCGGELCGGFSKLGFTQCDGSGAVCIKRLYSESDRRLV